jgi:hypothetical protein
LLIIDTGGRPAACDCGCDHILFSDAPKLHFLLQPDSKDTEVAVRHNAETVAMLRIATRFRLTAPIFGSKLRRRAEAGGALNVHYSIV